MLEREIRGRMENVMEWKGGIGGKRKEWVDERGKRQ